jgi:hypothetical protein
MHHLKTQFNSVVDEPQLITKVPPWSAILQLFLLPPYTTSVTTYVGESPRGLGELALTMVT